LKHSETKSDKKPTLNYVTFDTDKLELVLMGDEHAGYRYYNEDFHNEILDYCWDYATPIILMGDHLDTAVRDSVGSGLFDQDENLQAELENFFERYKPFADEGLILGLHRGNHEERIYKNSGLDLVKIMAKGLDVPCFGWGKLHYIKVGDQGYTLYTTHGASGARLPHTKIKACLDLANVADADIYAHGHLHDLDHKTMSHYRPDLRKRTVDQSERHYLLTGCYLDYWGSYGHMKAYTPNKKGSPKVKLHGDKKMIRVSL
jgi:hypothetical protein